MLKNHPFPTSISIMNPRPFKYLSY